MTREEKKHEVMMELAEKLSVLSTCSRRVVGCVITDDRFIIVGTGYNGAPHGQPHCCDLNPEGNKDQCHCRHAENNAIHNGKILFYSYLTNYENIAIPHKLQAYVTTFPCPDCMQLLIDNNVFRIFYRTKYKYYEASMELAEKYGVEVISMENPLDIPKIDLQTQLVEEVD